VAVSLRGSLCCVPTLPFTALQLQYIPHAATERKRENMRFGLLLLAALFVKTSVFGAISGIVIDGNGNPDDSVFPGVG